MGWFYTELKYPEKVYKMRKGRYKRVFKEINYAIMMGETLGYKIEIHHHGTDDMGYIEYRIIGKTSHHSIILMHLNRKINRIVSIVNNKDTTFNYVWDDDGSSDVAAIKKVTGAF